MDIIRRNTDYALRLIALLARSFPKKESISAKCLSERAVVSYPITCKLLQKLQKKDIVRAEMGPKGGYLLARSPEQITFLEVVQTIQGPIHVNRCFQGHFSCPLKKHCPLRKKLIGLQNGIMHTLGQTKLSDLVSGKEFF